MRYGTTLCLLALGVLSATVAHATTYTYDELDRLVRVDYDNGASITYTYDPAGNLLEVTRVASTDDDTDGVPNASDNCPTVANADQADFDNDGLGDACDPDDDNDGVDDADDAFPMDGGETVDTDGDGTGDNADADDDNDGVDDEDDAFPLDPAETIDTDGDGTGNNADPDDDNDGVDDGDDAFPLDPAESADTDSDGIGNNADPDDDDDGLTDVFEAANGLNSLDDRDAMGDADGDGASNLAEAQDGSDLQDAASQPAPPTAVTLVSSVLPGSRSVQIDGLATAFATVINAGADATDCSLAPLTPIVGKFFYQTTDPATNEPIGTRNTPVAIAAGGLQTFIFGIRPNETLQGLDVELRYDCADTDPASFLLGINTMQLSASSTPVPDVVALAATADQNGIVDLPGTSGVAAFAVASVNVGSTGEVTVSADTFGRTLPVSVGVCQTNPSTGACIEPSAPAPSATVTIDAGATPTFSFFVSGSGDVPFAPGTNRIRARFVDQSGGIRGSTSVAVRTVDP